MCVSFAVAFQTFKIKAAVCKKCLVKIEKALHVWVGDMNKNMF